VLLEASMYTLLETFAQRGDKREMRKNQSN
jgi:hypothetical protein